MKIWGKSWLCKKKHLRFLINCLCDLYFDLTVLMDTLDIILNHIFDTRVAFWGHHATNGYDISLRAQSMFRPSLLHDNISTNECRNVPYQPFPEVLDKHLSNIYIEALKNYSVCITPFLSKSWKIKIVKVIQKEYRFLLNI